MSNKILFEDDSDNLKVCLQNAVQNHADLRGAELRGANLWGADLWQANLRGADLRGANLRGAKITNVLWPSATMVLLIDWYEVSDKLTLDLIRFDASNHANPETFIDWAKNGSCPYENSNIERSANFKEKRYLIEPSFLKLKPKPAYELMQMLLKECCHE